MKTIYQSYEEIKLREIRELKERLVAFGREAHFGPDYTGPGATGTDRPVVMCNLNRFCGGPCDVMITHVYLNDKDDIVIHGTEAEEHYNDLTIPLDDIAYGHIDFITSAIPQHSLWLRLGASITGSKQEIEAVIKGDEDVLLKIINEGRYEINGQSYIPKCSVETWNEENDADLDATEVDFYL